MKMESFQFDYFTTSHSFLALLQIWCDWQLKGEPSAAMGSGQGHGFTPIKIWVPTYDAFPSTTMSNVIEWHRAGPISLSAWILLDMNDIGMNNYYRKFPIK